MIVKCLYKFQLFANGLAVCQVVDSLNRLSPMLQYWIKCQIYQLFRLQQGMLRFDPTQPEHAKYLAPVELKEVVKKSKKKKFNKDKEDEIKEQVTAAVEVEKVEVSKEQFYKISDSLKETITQPNEFSLRSLFASKVEDTVEGNLNIV